jgi:hypothetical protein
MKIFTVKKGTKVVLSNDDGNNESIIAKCEAVFDLEDIVEDPVSHYNKQTSEEIKKELGGSLITIDYYKFRLKKGVHTSKDYKFAYVAANKVKTLC